MQQRELRTARCAIVAAAMLALTAGAASAQSQDPVLAELMRKAAAREEENGFCATTGWPAGNRETNRAFWESADRGARSMDVLDGGASCGSMLVTDVYAMRGRKCVRFMWWQCERGKQCARGTNLSCKAGDGSWSTKTL